MIVSEKRELPRVAVCEPATLQILGASASENGTPLQAVILDASPRGMRMLSAAPVIAGQAVKVETGESMFLGEVCYCAVNGAEGGYSIGIEATQCLTGLVDLRHLITALSPKSERALQRA